MDLILQASEPDGYWVEVSKHREQVMSVYNQYQVKRRHELSSDTTSFTFPEEQLNQMAWFSLFGAIWQTGYLLNRHTFTSDPEIYPPIGPLGKKIPWSKDNADLSQAVLVSLSASSKTARGFAWQILTKRAHGSGPLAFLQVTQAPDAIRDVAARHAQVPFGAFDYSQLDGAVDLTAEFKPQKIILVDFGARDNAVKNLMGFLSAKPELEGLETVIVHVGGEQKVQPFPYSIIHETDARKGVLSWRKPGYAQRTATIRQNPMQHRRHPRRSHRIRRQTSVPQRPSRKLERVDQRQRNEYPGPEARMGPWRLWGERAPRWLGESDQWVCCC